DPHVIVLPVHEIRERREKGPVERRLWCREPLLRLIRRFRQENRFQLFLERGRDRNEIGGITREKIQLVQRVQPLELLDGIRRVIHADVDVAIGAAEVPALGAHDELCSALPADPPRGPRPARAPPPPPPPSPPPPPPPATSAAISRSASEPRAR